MTTSDEVLGLVERVASRLPGVPRLAILEVVEEEWDRLCAATQPHLRPLVAPSALQRLRSSSAA